MLYTRYIYIHKYIIFILVVINHFLLVEPLKKKKSWKHQTSRRRVPPMSSKMKFRGGETWETWSGEIWMDVGNPISKKRPENLESTIFLGGDLGMDF